MPHVLYAMPLCMLSRSLPYLSATRAAPAYAGTQLKSYFPALRVADALAALIHATGGLPEDRR